VVRSFGISSQQISSAKELHIALQQIHTGLHVIVAKMPDREQNAVCISNVLEEYSKKPNYFDF
jgi:hypothetical protein